LNLGSAIHVTFSNWAEPDRDRGVCRIGSNAFHPQNAGSNMTKLTYYVVLALVACLALSTTASAKKSASSKSTAPRKAAVASKDAVTLEIAGPADAQAVAAYQKALKSSGLSAKIHENKKGDKPLKVMAAVDKTMDLGPYGKAVMTAVPTKPGQLPPGLELLIYAPLTKETSQQALAKLEKVKGVDPKHSTMDVKKGSLRVRISGAEHVTAEDIIKAVEEAKIAPKLVKEGRTKKI
jgi:hypothetical protein